MFFVKNDNKEKFANLKKCCLEEFEHEEEIYSEIIELKKQLEKSKKRADKEVLVEVYNWLDFRKSGYELYIELTKNSFSEDMKTLVKKKTMESIAKTLGDEFAIQTPSDRFKIKYRRIGIGGDRSELPKFKYHKNPLETKAFEILYYPVKCKCCNEFTWVSYSFPLYCEVEFDDENDFICPDCVASGVVANKLQGSFQEKGAQKKFEEDFLLEESLVRIRDVNKESELLYKTPSFQAFQMEIWRAHCNDYCEFIGYVSADDLREMGIMEEVLKDPLWSDTWWGDFPIKDVLCNLINEWDDEERSLTHRVNKGEYKGKLVAQGYLFRCLECGKYLVWYDFC